MALALTIVIAAASCSSNNPGSGSNTSQAAEPATTSSTRPPDTSSIYSDPANWLCRPSKVDTPCDGSLDVTSVAADGSRTVEHVTRPEDPPIDCFYVYPTVSSDPAPNADLHPGPEEVLAVRNQAAPFGSTCRVFAPVYRQIPLAGLSELGGGKTTATAAGAPNPREVAYGDVADAWRYYLNHDNNGRGVVLIGHSQGTAHLTRLIREQIDPDPAVRALLVSAILLGGSVTVPEGADVGGDFASVPLCRSNTQVGCVITYASFRSTSPPPSDSYFGRPDSDGGVAGCTNPANLAGGPGELDPRFLTDNMSPYSDPTKAEPITTPWFTMPGLLSAQCVQRNGLSYLEVTVHGDQPGPRVHDIGGDLTPEWGLHIVDANIAMGNLVDVVTTQAKAYAGN